MTQKKDESPTMGKIFATIFIHMVCLFASELSFAHHADISACFTPSSCGTQIVDCIGFARATIRVAAYSFTDPDIADALILAHERGVCVLIVLDRGQRKAAGGQARRCNDSGIMVRFDPEHPIQHNKFMVIDSSVVITGSYNFTRAARKNAENVLFISSPEIATEYEEEWNKHWNHGVK